MIISSQNTTSFSTFLALHSDYDEFINENHVVVKLEGEE